MILCYNRAVVREVQQPYCVIELSLSGKDETLREDYQRARRLGEKAYRKAASAGKYPYLPALDEMISPKEIAAEVPVGHMEIPTDSIVGTRTKGRQNAFALNFMPLLELGTEFESKWNSLYESQLVDGIREAIIVYEYMRRFYVLEGNKRVSVAKFCQIADMEAEVTRILPVKTEDEDIRLYYEFVRFFEVCPTYDVEFSKLGSYKKLANLLGRDLEQEWTADQVRELNFMYSSFAKIFLANGGDHLNMTPGDALLIYLGIYGTNSLLHESKSVLEVQIKKLWKEYRLEANDNRIDLLKAPEEAPRENGILSGILKPTRGYTPDHPLRVAFLYRQNPQNSRWVYGHELGRLHLAQCFQGAVSTVPFLDCLDDGKTRKAIDAAAADEDRIIFTTSPTQMTETLKSAIHYPDTQFLNCSINLSHHAVQTYYARTYEAKYLMGALAAGMADNHKIGYRAAYPIYGTLSDINAFAIGAAMVDPRVRVYLSWSAVEGDGWEETLKDKGIRVISGPDLIQPDQASRKYGVYLLGEDGSVSNLAAPVLNWGNYYEQILRPVVEGDVGTKMPEGKDQALNYWWGLSADVIDVIVSQKTPYYTRKMLDYLKAGVISGRVSPFQGEIHSQTGLISGKGDRALSDHDIITMNWLNDNVIGTIPNYQDLNEAGRRVAAVIGVKKDKDENTDHS